MSWSDNRPIRWRQGTLLQYKQEKLASGTDPSKLYNPWLYDRPVRLACDNYEGQNWGNVQRLLKNGKWSQRWHGINVDHYYPISTPANVKDLPDLIDEAVEADSKKKRRKTKTQKDLSETESVQ